jgi:hypothetical protein
MKAVCRFKFAEGTQRQFIETSIASAIFNAECVFGKPRVRVSGVAYYLAEDNPGCVIDVSTEVGEHVAQVFTGIVINTLGEEKFSVRRIEGEPAGVGRYVKPSRGGSQERSHGAAED